MKKIIAFMLCVMISSSAFAGGGKTIRKFFGKEWSSNKYAEMYAEIARKVEAAMQRYSFRMREQLHPSTPNLPGFSTAGPEIAEEAQRAMQQVMQRSVTNVEAAELLSALKPESPRLKELKHLETNSQGKINVLLYDSLNHDPMVSQLDQLVVASYSLYKEGRQSPLFERFRTRPVSNEFGEMQGTELIGTTSAPISVFDLRDMTYYVLPPGSDVAVIKERITEQTPQYNLPRAEGNPWFVPSMFLTKLEEIALRSG
ncbi:MAG: hypothetical protein J5601_05885, partial [Elusimicrobiaceae bacterium]|nr:hypothetical protein [Elusimicrobiaceae bacterium]